jgi:hypothetical protein
MKTILLLISLTLFAPATHAAFIIKSTQAPQTTTQQQTLSSPPHDEPRHSGYRQKGGGWGIESIVAACTYTGFALAIIFGIVGLCGHKAHRKLALAGLIIGAIEMLLISVILLSIYAQPK